MIAEMTPVAVREAMAATNAEFLAALKRGDAVGMAAVYTREAKVLPPNMEMISGRESIQEFWQAMVNMGIAGAELETVEADFSGEITWEVGKFKLMGAAGQVLDAGKYIVVWKREEGRWRWHRDIFNSSRPAG